MRPDFPPTPKLVLRTYRQTLTYQHKSVQAPSFEGAFLLEGSSRANQIEFSRIERTELKEKGDTWQLKRLWNF